MTEKEDKILARRASRTIALEAIFAYLVRNESISIQFAFEHVLSEFTEKKTDPFALEILAATVENLKKIKVIIRAHAPEFSWEKIAPINRALLVLGVAEMKFLETPPVVVINEYIELAKLFGEDRSGSFINGVLDQFRKNIDK